MISLLFTAYFSSFLLQKIGHGRPSVKNRYAISDKNILRSYVVRYFYLKFLCLPFIHALGEVDEKRKKMCSCAVWGG